MEAGPALDWAKGNALALIALVVSIAAFGLTLYRDVLLRPAIRYSVTALNAYPGAGASLSLAVKRPEIGSPVALQHGVKVTLRSSGWTTASEVELRVRAEEGTVIVQVHTDNRELVEKLPDIGRQGAPEVFVPIRRMVPGERVDFTFWYGFPGDDKKPPPRPLVLVRHSDALGRREGPR